VWESIAEALLMTPGGMLTVIRVYAVVHFMCLSLGWLGVALCWKRALFAFPLASVGVAQLTMSLPAWGYLADFATVGTEYDKINTLADVAGLASLNWGYVVMAAILVWIPYLLSMGHVWRQNTLPGMPSRFLWHSMIKPTAAIHIRMLATCRLVASPTDARNSLGSVGSASEHKEVQCSICNSS
jgi:hypothetical protein